MLGTNKSPQWQRHMESFFVIPRFSESNEGGDHINDVNDRNNVDERDNEDCQNEKSHI